MNKHTYWLLVHDSDEPRHEGPYVSDEARLLRARDIRAEDDDCDVSRLDVDSNGIPSVTVIREAELQESMTFLECGLA